MPIIDGDVLAGTRQVVGDPSTVIRAIFNLEAWSFTVGQFSLGIVVAVEHEAIELAGIVLVILELDTL